MNPYEVLGIPENASDEQIKTAYKELVRKYHPDKYQNNPLADLAEEKLQEVNEAYDTIMKTRGQGSGGGYGYNNSYNNGYGGGYSYDNSGSYAYGSADYMQIRRNIDAGNLAAAEHMLNETSDRSAEWFFLSGVVSSRKGWYDDAVNKLQTACNMEPSNREYQQHLSSMMGRGMQYQNTAAGRGYNMSNDDMCCQALQCYICADCCCDCI